MFSARSLVTVVGAAMKSYRPDISPGISPEKLVLSIVISRFIRFAASVNKSMLNPSMPPPSFGIAWGANVPSTPVRSGWAIAAAGIISATASARRRNIIFMEPRVS